MNETAAATTSSTTSSAAAVADSASAVATTKTASTMNSAASVASASATTTTATTTTAKATSVKLLIKASNQQYDDQILDIDLLWTVKRLKTHLEMVYPNKPPVDEQKLIYSGQLLNDSLLLKDVIRSYKDVYTHNHIIHLVYTPKNALNTNFKQKPKVISPSSSAAANMSHSGNNGDGLRQRHIAGNDSTNVATPINYQQQYYQQYQQQQQNFLFPQMQQQMQNLQCPTYDANSSQNVLPFALPGQFNIQAMATHQAAMYHWMQQVYSQYMEQYIRMANTSTPSADIANLAMQNFATATAANLPPIGVSPLGYNPFLQQLPFIAPNTAVGAAAAGANNPVISAASLLSQPGRVQPLAQAVPETDGNTATQAAVGEQPPQAPAQPERQQAVAPRFPNIVQEEQENRDWLDSFFAITRLAIFLTILYFNSSPLRCIVVIIIASSIYLYHIGLLRPRNERNNNNINRNNNAADADQIRRGVRQVQQAAQADERRNPDNDVAAAVADDGAVDRPQTAAEAAGAESTPPAAAEAIENNDNAASVISVLRTFVVTFFTSLLPEPPTL